MADADEDKIHPDVGDGELDDETPDFRTFSTLLKSKSSTLPKRGEKDFEPHGTIAQADVLAQSRQEMHEVLSHLRVHRPERQIKAVYVKSTGMTRVEHPKSKLFQTIGKTDNRGVTWLLPEEALYLLERGDLDIRWDIEDEFTLSTEDISEEDGHAGKSNQDRCSISFSLQTAYAVFVGDGEKGISLERFNVFSNLKRAGFAVFRAPSWNTGESERSVLSIQETNTVKQQKGAWSWLYKLIHRDESPPFGPLLGSGPHRSYPDIYRYLTLVPYYDPSAISTREPDPSAQAQADVSLRVSFFVYKPRDGFKKSTPGEPDFRIAVVDARDSLVPTIEQLDGLFSSVPHEPPQPAPENDNAGKMYARLKHGYRNVIVAIVDQGIISYLRLSDAGFGREKLYNGAGRSKFGNKGGKRGGFTRRAKGGKGGRARGS